MVVVVIIGILVAIAIPIYGGIQETAQRRTIEANLRTIDGSISIARAEDEVLAELTDLSDLADTYLEAYLEPIESVSTETYNVVEVAPGFRASVNIPADTTVGGITEGDHTLADVLALD